MHRSLCGLGEALSWNGEPFPHPGKSLSQSVSRLFRTGEGLPRPREPLSLFAEPLFWNGENLPRPGERISKRAEALRWTGERLPNPKDLLSLLLEPLRQTAEQLYIKGESLFEAEDPSRCNPGSRGGFGKNRALRAPYPKSVPVTHLPLHFEKGEPRLVREIAKAMAWIFQGQRVHKEALTALALFCQAVEAEEADADWTRRLVKYLYRAQYNSKLHFDG
jgi:hypothetical protein